MDTNSKYTNNPSYQPSQDTAPMRMKLLGTNYPLCLLNNEGHGEAARKRVSWSTICVKPVVLVVPIDRNRCQEDCYVVEFLSGELLVDKIRRNEMCKVEIFLVSLQCQTEFQAVNRKSIIQGSEPHLDSLNIGNFAKALHLQEVSGSLLSASWRSTFRLSFQRRL
ncbi:hypothetical protein BGZ60DRAFT_91143 [Tricladium varicosporioides]|nr:hypothetical protein BGZ60DRAFT_91143 [Hymenoscyphus varicosporioides]